MKRLLPVIALLFVLSCKEKEVIPKPIADFTYSEIGNGLINFRNASINSTKFQWNFGNGEVSNESRPATIKYTSNGQYTIKLIAQNDQGDQSQATQTINVQNVVQSGEVTFWTNFNSAAIDVYIEGKFIGTNTKYIAQGGSPDCFSDGFPSARLTPGTYSFTAKSRDSRPLQWAGTVTVINGQCRAMQLTN